MAQLNIERQHFFGGDWNYTHPPGARQ
jgi:hypothetical protein